MTEIVFGTLGQQVLSGLGHQKGVNNPHPRVKILSRCGNSFTASSSGGEIPWPTHSYNDCVEMGSRHYLFFELNALTA
jgi:hypothetical protein